MGVKNSFFMKNMGLSIFLIALYNIFTLGSGTNQTPFESINDNYVGFLQELSINEIEAMGDSSQVETAKFFENVLDELKKLQNASRTAFVNDSEIEIIFKKALFKESEMPISIQGSALDALFPLNLIAGFFTDLNSRIKRLFGHETVFLNSALGETSKKVDILRVESKLLLIELNTLKRIVFESNNENFIPDYASIPVKARRERYEYVFNGMK